MNIEKTMATISDQQMPDFESRYLIPNSDTTNLRDFSTEIVLRLDVPTADHAKCMTLSIDLNFAYKFIVASTYVEIEFQDDFIQSFLKHLPINILDTESLTIITTLRKGSNLACASVYKTTESVSVRHVWQRRLRDLDAEHDIYRLTFQLQNPSKED